jgi:hypothetical protein
MAAIWSIASLDRQVSLDGKADVVTAVHWEVIDTETVGSGDDEITYRGRVYGSIGLDTSDLSSFTPYEDITEENAIAWAKVALGSDEVAKWEKSVADQKSEAKTPTKGTGVPW